MNRLAIVAGWIVLRILSNCPILHSFIELIIHEISPIMSRFFDSIYNTFPLRPAMSREINAASRFIMAQVGM